MHRDPNRRPGAAKAALAAALIGLASLAGPAACSDPVSEQDKSTAPPSSGQPAPEAGVNEAARALLPQEFIDGAPIKVGTEAFYPPYEYLDDDGQTIVGLDVDLFTAVAAALGVEFTIDNAAFDSLLPGLDTGRWDVIVAALTDNANRQQNYDMVDYFTTGQTIVVLAGNPDGITKEADLCGHAVSVLVASAQETILQEFNAELCPADQLIEILAQTTDDDAYMQLQTGRVQATLSQDPVARDRVAKVGGGSELELGNAEPFQTKPLGYALPKQSTQLRDALQAALQGLIDDGSYATILEKYGLVESAIGEITVNAGE